MRSLILSDFRRFLFAGPYKPVQRNVPVSGMLHYGSPYIALYGLPREPFLELQGGFT